RFQSARRRAHPRNVPAAEGTVEAALESQKQTATTAVIGEGDGSLAAEGRKREVGRRLARLQRRTSDQGLRSKLLGQRGHRSPLGRNHSTGRATFITPSARRPSRCHSVEASTKTREQRCWTIRTSS